MPLLTDLGFECVEVDDSNSRMDVYELGDEDIKAVVTMMGDDATAASVATHSRQGCSHAKKAEERRAAERVDQYLQGERDAGIHWGNPEFDFTKDVDMNQLCARVVIYAKKPL